MLKIETSEGSICCQIKQGSGTPIVFIHGNSLSSRSFKLQLKDAEISNPMYVIDLPGHGESEKPKHPNECYSINGYVQLLVELIDLLDIDNCILCGHSLGGHIALETASISEKVKGLILMGTPPLGIPPDMPNAFLPHPAANFAFMGELTQEQAEELADTFRNDGNTKEMFEDVMKTDPNARSLLLNSIMKLEYKNEIEIIETIPIPVLLLIGAHDPLVNVAYLEKLKPKQRFDNKVHRIPNSGHSPQLENSSYFNSLISVFSRAI